MLINGGGEQLVANCRLVYGVIIPGGFFAAAEWDESGMDDGLNGPDDELYTFKPFSI